MKKLRVFCTDPDATDSSSDEEDDKIPECPTKYKRFLREMTIAADEPPPEKPTSPPLETPQKVVEKYPGVRKRISGKYVAEIRDPFKKRKIWLGSFSTAKDAYDVYCRKKREFEALRSEKISGVEAPEGVKRYNSGKWGVLIDDPNLRKKVWLGSYDSVGEAVRVYREKECEFEEGFGVRKERKLSDLYGGVDNGRCGNVGASTVECLDGGKSGNVGTSSAGCLDNEKSVNVGSSSVGCLDDEKSVNVGSSSVGCLDDGKSGNVSDGKSGNVGASSVECLDDGKSGDVNGSCVECLSGGRWEGRVWNPEIKSLMFVGVFDTRTQAQFAVKNKEVLFRRRFGVERDECRGGGMADGVANNGVVYESSDVIIALAAPRLSKEDIAKFRKIRDSKCGKVIDGEQSRDTRVHECEFGNVRRETVSGCESGRVCNKGIIAKEKIGNSKFVEKIIREKFGPELPPGVRVTKAGKFGAWVTHPVSGKEYCLRSYDTIEEALKGIRSKMAQFEKEFNSKKRARPNGDVLGTPKKAVSEATHGSPTSVLDVRNEEHETSGTNVKVEVEYGPSHESLNMAFKDKGDVSFCQNKGFDNTYSKNQQNLDFALTFDELVKSGVINEYGQLLGEYCKCDESMWFSSHNNVGEDETTTWLY